MREASTLADYRAKYALYRSDKTLRDLHAKFPMITTWDDHEVQDNYAGGAPGGGLDPSKHYTAARKAAGYKAFFEAMPFCARARAADLPRSCASASNVDLIMLDQRQYRDDQPCGDATAPPCPELDAAARVPRPRADELGQAAPRAHPARPGRSIGNETDDDERRRCTGGTYYGFDNWQGYTQRARGAARAHQERRASRTSSSSPATSTRSSPATCARAKSRGETVALEFVGGSITSQSLGETDLPLGGGQVLKGNDANPNTSPAIIDALRAVNPWVDQADFDHHGYGARQGRRGNGVRRARSSACRRSRRGRRQDAPTTGFRYTVARGQTSIKGVNGPPRMNRRPRLELRGSSATPEEAAAVMAAVEQFLRDTAPPPAPEAHGRARGCAPRAEASKPWIAPPQLAVNTEIRIRIWYFGRMSAKPGSLENPEVREDVPGHIIPILQREFDDFDNEAEKFLAGDTPENEFIGFRLKQGVYGQRQADVQMIRVKLPFGGITPEQMETFADVIEKWAPLNKGHITTRQNIQIHHVPLRDAAALIREISDAGLSSREGCGNTVRNVTADPWAGVCHDETFDPTPYAGAYVRYFVRHPTTQLMPRKVKTAFTGSDTDRALTGIHDVAFIARERDGVKGFEMRIGGGTSIMPRVAPDADRLRARRRRRVPQVHRGRPADLRPPGLAARQPRPRPPQGDGRQDRHRGDARAGRGGAARATGSPSATSTRSTACSCTTRRPTRPTRRLSPGSPNGDGTEFLRFRAANVEAQRQKGFSRRPGEGRARRPQRPSSSAGSPTSCASSPAATRARPCTRTSCCAGCATRRSTTSGGACHELGLGEAGADQVNDVVSCPGHRLLQARHHELDGPQPRRSPSGSRR